MKPRVVMVSNRFRSYDLLMYEVLSDAFELINIWISPPPTNESIPPALAAKMTSLVVDDEAAVLSPRDVRRNAQLFRLVVREGRGAALIIASTSDSWKARVVYGAARACGVPIALRKEKWRDHLHEHPSGARGLYWRMQARWTLHIERHAAGMLVGGSRAAAYLVERGVDAERVFPFRYLHHDLADKPVRADVVDELRRRKGGRIAFLYLNRIMHQTGLDHLIRAVLAMLATGRDAVLFVVGDPIAKDTGRGMVSVEYYEECKRLAAGEPRVIFFPATPPQHVVDYYTAADVFVHSHQAEVDGVDVHEGWGNVITEAASMEKALIATDRVAAAFDLIVEGENGFLVPVARLEPGLAEAMARFVDRPELARRFGVASRRRYEAFVDARLNVASLNEIIARASASRRAR